MIVVIQPPDHHQTSSRISDYVNSMVDWQSWVSQEIHGKCLGEKCEFVKKNIPVKIRKKREQYLMEHIPKRKFFKLVGS